MNRHLRIWLAAFGFVAFTLLLLGTVVLLWQHGWLHVRVSFAEEQTEIFEAMRTKALEANDAKTAAECLNYVVNYYPSGSKQEAGTKMDSIVERARTAAVREIIADLRGKTGENLGEDPDAWIGKYARR